MAVSPGTTNIAVDREIAERMKAVAKEYDMKLLEFTNQLLNNALAMTEIEIEVKKIKLNPRATKKTGRKSAR